MAVVYFTSNASTGAGSLVEAVKNASPGDVVRPDETVFERGSTIEIALASTLTIDKNLTLDASPFRVLLNGGGAIRCASVAANVTATFIGVDFVAGYNAGVGGGINAPGTTDVTFERCGFYGCKSNLGGGAYTTGTTRYNNCAFLGCAATESGGAVYASKKTTLNGVTAAGCVAANKGDSLHIVNGTATAVNAILCGSVGNPQFLTATGSVVGVASSSVGFVASPPDDLSVENWAANLWQSWNLRLLDDASGAPSPYRDSGDVDAASKYDLDGNFRGRESDGASTCSPGAYETIQADLFWVGVDATGAEVVSPSFLTSDGWAASRFATFSGDAAPQVGQTLFVGHDVAFVDALATSSNQRHGLYVGGGTVVAFESDARLFLDKLQVAANARLAFNRGAADSSRFGAFSRVDGIFTTLPNAVADDNVYLASVIVYGTVISEPTYGTLNVLTSSDVSVERMSGVYVCNAFRIQQNGTKVAQTITASDGTTIRARSVNFGSADAANYVESFFSRPVTLKLQGAASVSMPTTTRESWTDDFVVDVTDATSATLTLCGQTVCGGAPTSEITLNGSAKINGANPLIVANLTFTEGATVEFTNDASVILTTASATSATATGPGAFFASTAAPEGLTLENGAVWGDASAGVTSLDVDSTSATTATFTVVKTNADANIVAQYSDDDGATWKTVATTADVDEYELTVAQGADVTVRVATATGWIAETVSTAPFLPVWTVSNASESVIGVVNAFEVATGGSNDGLNVYDFNDYGYL